MEMNRDPIAAFRRLNAVETPAQEPEPASLAPDVTNAIRDELNLQLCDIRLAHVLNIIDVARAHGEQAVWTSEHSVAIRDMMKITDVIATGASSGVVPHGFLIPARTAIAEALLRAKAKVLGPEPVLVASNGQDHAETAG